MFGPNITQHYHAFGWNDSNNEGRFLAIKDDMDFTIVNGSGHRWWNGSGGGGGFVTVKDDKVCNMITSHAVDSRTDTTYKPNSMAQLPLIKF